MDGSTSAESPKKQKIEGPSNDENEDRISQLPEGVLGYILSFLPAKFTVGTSILSTRWRYLWTLIQNFEFNDELQYASKKKVRQKERLFFDFVDKVLFVNDDSYIQRFILTCRECDEHRFGKWMSAVMRRKVEELILSIATKSLSYFPYDLFNSGPLRILKIDMEVTIKIPALMCFANLKFLHLESTTFFGGQSIQEVSISFPVLEELIVCNWRWLSIKRINISSPKLRRLQIDGRWSHDSLDCEIRITAESLMSLKLEKVLSYEYSLCNLSSLVDAYLDLPPYDSIPDDTIAHRMCSLISGICNVRDLELSLNSIDTLSLPTFLSKVHSFPRLKHLTVDYGYCTSGKRLIDLLSNMPNIESVYFSRGLNYFVFKGNGRILGTTPLWFLSHLKLIDIKYFHGTRDQQWFINFLIRSVRAVDKWKIKFRDVEDKRMIAQLEMLAKDSNCVLEFK